MNDYQGFLHCKLKLDTILNTTIDNDGCLACVKDLPDCDFSTKSHQLPNSIGQSSLPLSVLHLNGQGLQSTNSKLKFLVASSQRDVVAFCKTFVSDNISASMLDIPN